MRFILQPDNVVYMRISMIDDERAAGWPCSKKVIGVYVTSIEVLDFASINGIARIVCGDQSAEKGIYSYEYVHQRGHRVTQMVKTLKTADSDRIAVASFITP